MELKVEVKISPDLLKLGNRVEAGIRAGLLRAAGAVEAEAVRKAAGAKPKGGNLADRIRKYIEEKRAIVVSTAPYSIFVHEGTGLFGPLKTRIVPKKAKALRFFIGGEMIFARSTKGQKPNPFMRRAFKKVESRIPEIFSQAIDDFIHRA